MRAQTGKPQSGCGCTQQTRGNCYCSCYCLGGVGHVGSTSSSCWEDSAYKKMVDLVREGTIRRYWIEQDLLYTKRGRIFVSKGELRKYLMTETHDPHWAGHPGRGRMVALLSQTYYWSKMEDDVELYVRTCLVCQQDKTLRQREIRFVTAAADSRKALGISFDGLHCWFSKGGWHEHDHGCHGQIHQVRGVCGCPDGVYSRSGR